MFQTLSNFQKSRLSRNVRMIIGKDNQGRPKAIGLYVWCNPKRADIALNLNMFIS